MKTALRTMKDGAESKYGTVLLDANDEHEFSETTHFKVIAELAAGDARSTIGTTFECFDPEEAESKRQEFLAQDECVGCYIEVYEMIGTMYNYEGSLAE